MARISPGEHALANQALSLQLRGETRQALDLCARMNDWPLRLTTLVNLATLDPGVIGGPEEAAMLRGLSAPGLAPDLRIQLLFALGHARDRQQRHDEAFAAFAEGNRLKAARLDLKRVADLEATSIASVIRDFTPEFLARWSGRGHASAAPIFVVGKPRSGTTLIEQILASHPDVQGMGETNALGEAIGEQVYWLPTSDAAPDHFRRIGAAYLRSMRAMGWTRTARFVDKFPQNTWFIGVIALALPRAVILHSVRDPMDTSLSWHQNLFETGNDLSYDLAEIGRSYQRHALLMAHWDRVLPGRVVEVRHEDLVADPERRIRWLVSEVCGLAWDDACLRFHETKRHVATMSHLQVRRPMFTSSIGRWRPYERHLGPLIEALGPYGPGRASGSESGGG